MWLIAAAVLLVASLCGGSLMWIANGLTDDPADVAAGETAPDPVLERLRAQRERLERAEADERALLDAKQNAAAATLRAQADALLRGNRGRFLGATDPAAKRSVAWLSERFSTLRAMGVRQWAPTVTEFRRYDPTTERWISTVRVNYCFAEQSCAPVPLDLHTMWKIGQDNVARIVEVWPKAYSGTVAPPWTESTLRATVGKRVVVAATARNAGRIPSVLATAEAAARAADKYASGTAPTRYVVYLASEKEWDAWARSDIGEWVAGFAQGQAQSVVIRLSALANTDLRLLLRHELAHVATLGGGTRSRDRAATWWLVEGLAEYAAMDGRPVSAYPERSQTRRFVRGTWGGELTVAQPGRKASQQEASARYGVAYLGVSCLATRYGRAKMLAFFRAVVLESRGLVAASPPALGAQWPVVTKQCAAYIRRAAG